MKKLNFNPLALDKKTIAKLDEKQLLEVIGGNGSSSMSGSSSGCYSGSSSCQVNNSTGCVGSNNSLCDPKRKVN
ncbi:MAG: class I lanthipeptide [Flavobacterium sp.]|jgi:hypothetical protein|uniref:class I lanthipeptide n=1 Tax=Flavobacterium sp. TaxID=239 RepID=UPI003BA56B0C